MLSVMHTENLLDSYVTFQFLYQNVNSRCKTMISIDGYSSWSKRVLSSDR